MFLSGWAEISFHHLELKCFTHEIYPAIEISTKEEQVEDLLILLTARQIHDSAVFHVDRWRNLNRVEMLEKLILPRTR